MQRSVIKSRIFVLALIFLSWLGCTNIFGETEEKELSIIKTPNQNYKLRIVYTPSNATIQSSIQIWKEYIDKSRSKELLKSYERYNYVDTSYLQNDSTILIVLRDTISLLGNKPDTMMFNFSK